MCVCDSWCVRTDLRSHSQIKRVNRCSSGALATIINDRCCALGYDQRAEIFCERGRVANDSLPTNPSDFFLERYKAAYEAALNDFLVRVVEGETCLSACARI